MSNLPFWKFAGLLLLQGRHDGVAAFGFLSWGLWACSSKDTTWWTAGWYDVVPCGNKTSSPTSARVISPGDQKVN